MPRPLLAALAGAIVLGAVSQCAAQDLTITNARIVVGNGQVIENGSVVVRAGRISSVGAGTPSASAGTTVDARGLTLVPGFIDGHRHIMGGGNAAEWLARDAPGRMREFLEAGYTTLMEGGGRLPDIVQLKEAVDSGRLKGPRIVTSARADPDTFKSEAEARQRVRQIASAGVHIVKARIEPPADAAEVAMLAVVVDEARKHNLEVMVHAVSPRAMVAAVKAGAQKLVHTPHGGWVTPEEARLVRDAGVEMLSCAGFGVPVFDVHNQENRPTFRDGKPWPQGILNGQGGGQEAGEKAVNARTLFDAGVVFGYGTDTNYHPRAGLAHELRTLNLMFSPRDLIAIMGPNTAKFLEMSGDLGTLEVGKYADILALGGNPLEGYWHLLDVRLVVKGGEIMVDKRAATR